MPDNQKSPHEGHRNRLRERYLKDGLTSFEPHNVLELILFSTIPRKDTNVIAHDLINHFGSLEAVLGADPIELQKVKDVGPKTAYMLSIIPDISKYYISIKMKEKDSFKSLDDVAEFLRNQYLFEDKEVFSAICLDAAGKLISFDKLAIGMATHVDVDLAKVLQFTLAKNAASVIVAHNHPAGNLEPSTADLSFTSKLSDAFKLLRIKFIDHLIITPTSYQSLANHGLYSRYFNK